MTPTATAWSDDDRRQLVDSARDYLARSHGAAARQASHADPQGCDERRWQDFAELGWLALAVPQQHGGLSGSPADVAAVCEELGRALVAEPFVASAVWPTAVLRELPASDSVARLLAGCADGSQRLALACWEGADAFAIGPPATQAEYGTGGYRLHGAKTLVAGGAAAHALIVPARIDAHRHGLFLVLADAPGLQRETVGLVDGQRVAQLRLDAAHAAQLLFEAPPATIADLLQAALDHATVADCAQTVGTMQAAFDITLEYTRTRKQFGHAIADNQVVQHRLVDLAVEIAEARALTRAAADMLGRTLPVRAAARQRMVAAARSCVATAARLVWQDVVQLHGAIGMTQEYVVGAFVQRLALACTWFGSATMQLERLAALTLDNLALPHDTAPPSTLPREATP
jgi:butyryl-CoA dehydrogenase